jgi:hypothetical protein
MWVAGCLLAALAVAAGLLALALHRAEPFVRARIVAGLENRFKGRVELDGFQLSLFKGLRAEGHGLRIWPPAQVEGVAIAGPVGKPPMGQPIVRLEEFRFAAPWHFERGLPFRITVVELKGLEVDLPPRSQMSHATDGKGGVALPEGQSQSTAAGDGKGIGVAAGILPAIEVSSVKCSGARLRLETDKPGKLALEIAIARFKLTGFAAGQAMDFDAELTNPKPVGTITTTGSFGALNAADLGETPIKGSYRFEHADLAGFKGIAGNLSSTGQYEGTLRDLVVDGKTDTPDFRLSHFGQALALRTQFHAKVDGTNGDTWLEPVEATLGHSHFWVQGQIVRVPAEAGHGAGPAASKGHDIALTVNVDRGRIEDFLLLASHSTTPLLTGAVTVKTTLHIPPGTAPVHERMRLQGAFKLNGAHFASAKIQGRIEELSLRGQGRPKDVKTTEPGSVQSAMEGDFTMGGGVVALPRLKYTVPGAEIDLKGTYGLEGGALDFAGTAKMDATVSQMLGGWKGLLLKPVDRLFKKEGAGTAVAIHITGTRENPRFGVGLDRTGPR